MHAKALGRTESHVQMLEVSEEAIITDCFGLSVAKFSTASRVFLCLDIPANLLPLRIEYFYLLLLFYKTETVISAKVHIIQKMQRNSLL